jgi:dolichol-phosphate mannosyltransferase
VEGNVEHHQEEKHTLRAIVIIPTYNERNNIRRLAPLVLQQDPRLEVLIVDDNSPDGTGAVADELAAVLPRVHVLHRPRKQGLGPAYIAGFRYALAQGADLIFEMDADFSHSPDALPRFLYEMDHNSADLVLGSRYVAGGGVKDWELTRRIISQGGSLYARTILGVSIRDLTGGFKCFRREVLETIDLDAVAANGYVFQIEMTYRTLLLGFRVKEIPILFANRTEGQSKMSGAIFMEAATAVWQLRLRRARLRAESTRVHEPRAQVRR